MRSALPRRLRFGLALLAAGFVAAVAGPVFLPDPNAILDPRGAGLLPPLARVFVVQLADGTLLAGEAVHRSGDKLMLWRAGTWQELRLAEVQGVTRRLFVAGTDGLGRDVAARLVAAGRISLAIGFLALALAVLLGTVVGLLAGLGPGPLDRALMAVVDAALAIPLLFVLLAVSAFLGQQTTTVVLLLGFSSWMGVARLVRGLTLQVRQQPWFLAAKGLGLPPWRLAVVHVLPHLATPLLQDATLRLGDLILLEASLSFLGFGVPPPVPSWGSMAAEGFEVWRLAWWLPILPGMAVALVVLAFALVAEGLGELARGEA